MRGVITSMWWFMHERRKERGAESNKDQHNIIREHPMLEAGVMSGEENRMPVRNIFLFKPGLESLRKSSLSRIQYWLEKSGGIVRRWKTQEKVRNKHNEGRRDIQPYFGRVQ